MNGLESCFNHNDKILGDFGVRTMHAKQVGYFIHEHVHNYGHLEEVISGSVELILKSVDFTSSKILKTGEITFIPSGIYHTAVALEENTIVRCIFHARDAEGVTDMANHAEFT